MCLKTWYKTNNTRSSHNELVLERQELRPGKSINYINIQSSYVIIYDTFDEEKKLIA